MAKKTIPAASVSRRGNADRELDRQIGLRLKGLRHESGMSQTDLGLALGITFQQVQKYEKGTNRISGSRLIRTALALRVPAIALLDGIGPTAKPNLDGPLDELRAMSDGVDMVRAFVKIQSAGARRALVNMAKSMAGDKD